MEDENLTVVSNVMRICYKIRRINIKSENYPHQAKGKCCDVRRSGLLNIHHSDDQSCAARTDSGCRSWGPKSAVTGWMCEKVLD